MHRPLALVAALLLAGCLAPAEPAPNAGPGATDPALSWACPGAEPSEGPCFSVLDLGHERIAEPYLAAHPTNPKVFALGVNDAPSLADYAAGLPADRADFTRVEVFVTEDGGATWRRASPEPPRGAGPMLHPLSIRADPALLFDRDGVLHFTALASAGTAPQFASFLGAPGDNGVRTYYTRSRDLGATWEDLRILDDNGKFQDRNWVAYDDERHTFYVTWQNIPAPGGLAARSVEVAWTTDGGATWRTQPEAEQAPCYRAGDVTLHSGRLLLACSDGAQAPTGITVYSFEASTGRSSPLAKLAVGEHWPALTAAPDGSLLLRTQACFQEIDCAQDGLLRRSGDGGVTWSEAVRLSELMGDQAGDGVQAMWTQPGPDGAIHLLAASFRWLGDALPVIDGRAREHTTHHLVLSSDFAAANVTHLAAWEDAIDRSQPRLATIAGGDHFHAIAFGPDRGLVAVTVDGAIWIAALR